MYVLKNELGLNRLGVSASKKVGCAVVRNRVRRLIKENMRLKQLPLGYDMVVVVRAAAADADFYQIKDSLNNLLDRHKIV